MTPKQSHPWTPTDDRKLLLLADRGHSQAVCAKYLHRTKGAIASRLSRLRDLDETRQRHSPAHVAEDTRQADRWVTLADPWHEDCGGCGYTIVDDQRVACACTTVPHRRRVTSELATARRGERMEIT